MNVRFEGELPYVTARPEWGPPWRFHQLGSPEEIDTLVPPETGEDVYWAWLDEGAGLVRLRAFAVDDGIPEDPATGSAALQLTAELGRPIEIRQGAGAVLYARPVDDGRAEVGGRVVLDNDAEAPALP